MRENNIKVRQFVSKLLDRKNVFQYGRSRGWLEDQDERFADELLNRRTAARILHQFLKIEKGFTDITDISRAEELKDLYTCRVCASHIAQVYLQGFMDCRELEWEGQIVKVFDHLGLVSDAEVEKIICKISGEKL